MKESCNPARTLVSLPVKNISSVSSGGFTSILKILQFCIILFTISINVTHAEDAELYDDWGIIGLGSVYVRSSTLKITVKDITWPGCQPVAYKIVSSVNDMWRLHVPRLTCNGIRKDNGEGYTMILTLHNEDNLKIKVYDFKSDTNEDSELAWGEFYRIPFDEDRNLFGHIGESAITMYLNFSRSGDVEGQYYYDQYKKDIPLSGSLDGSHLVLNVVDKNDNTLETFDGQYKDGKINGNWRHKDKILPFAVVREPWEDHYISCEEMQKYPRRVFSVKGIDLGSGAGSPNDVDYECQGGLASLQFLKRLYDLAETIRSEGPQFTCSGSIVHAHWRFYHFALLEAGLAPSIHAMHNEQRAETAQVYNMYENALKYFRLWAHQSLYNYELYSVFWKEYNAVRPLLATHFKKKFNVSVKKANYYADNGLSDIVRRAAGAYQYDLHDGEPDITPIEKLIIRRGVKTTDLLAGLKGKVQQADLDQALRVALLYQKPKAILDLLVKTGAKINVGDESAIFFALRNHDNVKWLIKNGADINYANGFGKTVLFYAIGFNDHELVQLLIRNKADVNHSYKSKAEMAKSDWKEMPFYQSYCLLTHTKRTPLMHAAQHGDVEMIKLLIKNKAKIDSKDEQGYNATDYALMGNKPENSAYLISIGLQKNASHE